MCAILHGATYAAPVFEWTSPKARQLVLFRYLTYEPLNEHLAAELRRRRSSEKRKRANVGHRRAIWPVDLHRLARFHYVGGDLTQADGFAQPHGSDHR